MPYPSSTETRNEFNLRCIMKKTRQEGECLVWTGSVNHNGYPETSIYYKRVRIHKWYYETFIGNIPEGYDIDHTCGNRRCLAQEHLEPVTRKENLRRARVRKYGSDLTTHCPRGHKMTEDNTYIQPSNGTRKCRTCQT